jgi:hypothetical protein
MAAEQGQGYYPANPELQGQGGLVAMGHGQQQLQYHHYAAGVQAQQRMATPDGAGGYFRTPLVESRVDSRQNIMPAGAAAGYAGLASPMYVNDKLRLFEQHRGAPPPAPAYADPYGQAYPQAAAMAVTPVVAGMALQFAPGYGPAGWR